MKASLRYLIIALVGLTGLVALTIPSITANASTGINKQINFQGKVTNADGTNVSNGSYTFRFRIYTAATGDTGSPCLSTCIWEESKSLTVTDGIFQTNLGDVTSLPGSINFNTDNIYLGIKFNNDPAGTNNGEMSPRVQFTASPYAFNSDNLQGISANGFVQIGPGSVQADASTNSSVFINKTNTGNLLQLQASGVDAFVLSGAGDLAFGQNADHTLSVTQTSTNAAGKNLTVVAGAGGSGASANAGGVLTLQGGSGGGTNGVGGKIVLKAGAGSGSGVSGIISIQDSSGNATLDFNTSTQTLTCGLFTTSSGNSCTLQGGGALTVRAGGSQGGGSLTFNRTDTSPIGALLGPNTAETGDQSNFFQIQKFGGGQLFNVDATTNLGASNVIFTNPDISVNTWAVKGTAAVTLARTTTASQVLSGAGAISVVATSSAAAGDGIKSSFTLADSTTYALSFYAKLSSGTMTTLAAGYSSDGSTDSDCTLNSNTPVTGGWTRFSCTISTASSHSGTPFIYFKQTDAGVAHTYFIDQIYLEQGSSTSEGSYVTNPSFETNTTGWAGRGSGTIAVNTAFQLYGAQSGKVTTTATSNDGAKYNGNGTNLLAISTPYELSFYARADSGSFTARFGRSDNATTGGESDCSTGTVTTTWTRFTCSFTTGASISNGNYIYITQNDSTARSYYIDGVSLDYGSTLYGFRDGRLQVGGIISSQTIFQPTNDTTSAFQIQNATATTILNVDTVNSIVNVSGNFVASGTAAIQGTNALTLGTASTNNGAVIFKSSGGANTVTLAAPTTNPGSSYTLNLPITAPGTGQCLQSDGVTATQLKFDYCAIGGGDNVSVNGTPASDANFINTAATSTIAGTTFTLDTVPATDTIALTVGNATGSVAGVVSASTQTFGGDKTFTGSATVSPTGNGVVGLTVNGTSGTAATAVSIVQSGNADALTISSSGTGNLLKITDSTATARDVLTVADGGAVTLRNQTNSASALLIQNAGGTSALSFDTTNFTLKVFGSGGTNYASVSYDDASSSAIFAASSGTTKIGSGSGPINVTAGASSAVTITGHAASSFTTDSGALTLTGAAASTWSTTSGDLTLQGGSGNVSFGTSTNLTANGALTLQSGTSSALTLTGKAASTLSTTTGDLTLLAGGANKVVAKPGTDSTAAFQVQNAAGTETLTTDTTNSKLVIRGINSDAVIGSELVTSQDFTSANWTTCNGGAGGWAGTSTTATHNTGNTVTCSAAAGNFTVTAGTVYQIVFTVASNTTASNTVTATIGGVSSQALGANTTHTLVIKASTTGALTFTPTTSFNGVISAVSVKAITLANAAIEVKNSSNTLTMDVRSSGSNSNTFIGIQAGQTNTSGLRDTALGSFALISNTTGVNNTALGYSSLQLNTTGNHNTGLGIWTLQNNTTGSQNTAAGYGALNNNTTGNDNTAFGYSAGYQDPNVAQFITPSTISNAAAFGYGAQVQASNSLVLGGQVANQVNVGIGTTAPLNVLSVSPYQYFDNATTASQSTTTVTGTSTTFTNAMVGSQIIWADGSKATITGFTDTTHLTTTPSQTVSSQKFRIHYAGLQVTSAGNVGIGTTAPGAALEVDGSSVFKANPDSSTAFQIQNTAGTSIFSTNTLTSGDSLISNPSFEQNINGWSAKGTPTAGPSWDNTAGNAKFGNGYLKFSGDASGDGTQFNFPFAPSTTYSASFWAATSSGTGTLRLDRQDNGSDVGGCTDSSVTTTWTQFTCTFTTGSTINDASNIFFKQNAAGTPTFWIDGLTLVQAGTSVSFINPASSLQVDSNYSNLTINSLDNGSVQPWSLSASTLTAARDGAATTGSNGFVYVIGGSNGSPGNANNTVMYSKMNADGSLGTFTTTTALTNNAVAMNRFKPAIAVANGYIYVVGGLDPGNSSSTSSVFYAKLNSDGTVGTWYCQGGVAASGCGSTGVPVNGNSLPASRYGAGSVVSNGYMYVVGGCADIVGDCGSTSSAVYYAKLQADGSTSAWTTSSFTLSQSRGLLTATFENGSIIAMGGRISTPVGVTTVDKATVTSTGDIAANFSTTGMTALPANRQEHGTVILNGYVYVIGGSDGAASPNRVSTVYYSKLMGDGTNGSWQSNSNALPAVRSASSVFAANGYIYVMGGCIKATAGTCNSNDTTSVYVASTARTLIAGTLDLVGLSSQSLGDFGGGGDLTAGNGRFIGDLKVDGFVDLNNGLSVDSALNINAVSATTGQTIFNINNSSSNSIFSIRHMNTNFGSLATSGAFVSNMSYFGQEFTKDDRSTAIASVTATTVGDDLEWYWKASATSVTYQTPRTINGIARLGFPTTTTTSGFLAMGSVASTLNNIVAAANLPVIQMKVGTTLNSATSDIYWGVESGSTAGVTTNDTPPADGFFFWNNNAAGGWQGMVRSTAGGTIGTVTCPGSIVTTAGHLALGRIEVLDTTHVHFMIDNDSSDGVSFLDCGTVSGTLPTAQLSPFVEDNQSGAQGATHNIDVDYYRIWQDDSSGSVGSEAPIVGDASTPTTTDQKGIIDFQNATADDTTFDHDVYVKGTLYADKIKANQIEGLNVFTDQLDSLQKQLANEGASPSSASGSGASTSTGTTPTPASGLSFNMSSDLQTGGGLTVGGDAQFMGNAFFYKLVTFVEKTVFKNDISLEGHFATAGDAPTVAPGDTAGLQTAPTDGTPANLASVSISGNDTAGQLSVTLGDGAAAGNLAKISFKKPFGKAPRILLTPANDAASKMKYYVQSSNNDFTLASPDTLQAGTNISFNYWVIE